MSTRKNRPRATAAELDAQRQLTVLNAVEQDQRLTQRSLSAKLGIALGLTNIYVKRLIRKGYIKCVNVQSNRLLYLITPQGIAEKSRLTYQFMNHSLDLYRDVRHHLSNVLSPCRGDGTRVIALFGTGEAAELAYLSLKEQGFEPVAIFTEDGGGTFLGMPVLSISNCSHTTFDRLVVAVLDSPDVPVRRLLRAGVPAQKLLTLKPCELLAGSTDMAAASEYPWRA